VLGTAFPTGARGELIMKWKSSSLVPVNVPLQGMMAAPVVATLFNVTPTVMYVGIRTKPKRTPARDSAITVFTLGYGVSHGCCNASPAGAHKPHS
jgi:hypothetical protein